VRQAGANVGTASRLAQLCDVSLSAMLRGAKTGHLSAEVLLAIAEHGGVEAGALLIAAGKGETAKRIERLYGPTRAPLTDDETALLALDRDSKRQLRRLVDGLTTKRGPRP
jgi:hypothetical protein